jgi:DNA replication protein DnaC
MLNATPARRESWLKAHLGLTRYHPDVAKLETAIWNLCVGIAKQPWLGKRLVLFGNNGNGKSRCLRRVRRWVQQNAYDLPWGYDSEGQSVVANCLFVNWTECVNQFKQGHWDVDWMLEPTILLIDDIGAEHDPSRVGLEKLYMILERRERQWTVITTNLAPEFWESKFERRIADRLFRNADHVDLSNLPSFSTQ